MRNIASSRQAQPPVVLYNSAEIHARVKHLFSEASRGDRRIALVAYVGVDGEKYLPHPEALRVICNPTAGGTDPNTLRSLIKNRANVQVSDRLHMKVYWSSTRGCVITSANASSNALGRNGLKEAGIWLPSRSVDINRLIRYAKPRAIRESDLRRLDNESRELARNVKGLSNGRLLAFDEWYASPHRSMWKVGVVFDEIRGFSKAAKEQSEVEYGNREPYSWVSCRQGTIQKNNWILTFVDSDRGVTSVGWIYTDFVVKVSRSDKRYYDRSYPCHAVQVSRPSMYPSPPFKITPQFRRALRTAVGEYSSRRVIAARTDLPSSRLLKLIRLHYLNPAGRG